MTLWFILALMTVAAVFAVLWPLARRAKAARSGSDLAVYRDQLDELKRDRAAGLIGATEAEAARVEISRRLLTATDAAPAPPVADAQPALWRRRAVALVGLLLLPLGSGALYLSLGSPAMRSEPLAARAGNPAEQRSVAGMVAQVEAYLERNPQDGRGWEVLAPIYMREGRYGEAVKARRRALEILGADAARLGDLGEALVLAAGGMVTPEALALFQRAATLDRDEVMAAYYQGVAAKQAGRRDDAEKMWRALVARAPAGAPWLPLVQGALARIDEKDVPAVKEAAVAEHSGGAVQGMVERLAERLKKDGSNLEGWVQLVRSYRVLGQADKMAAAISEAQAALAGDPDKLRALAEAIKAIESGHSETAAAPGGPAVASPGPSSGPGSGPSAEDRAAAATLAPEQQTDMIRGMVDRLAGRLAKDGSDPDGWLRLVRAYLVLNDRAKAQAATADARRALASDGDKLRRFDEQVKELGLGG